MLGRLVNPVGKAMQAQFKTGAPFREQLTSIRNAAAGPGSAGANYIAAADELFADPLQEALMQLTGKIPLGTGKQSKLVGMADRMAASDEVKNILRAVPGLTAVYGAGVAKDVIDQVFDPESTGAEASNSAMDLLGMGAGAYGMKLGKVGGTTTAGKALAMMAGAGGAKLGTDAVQAVLGM